MKVRLSEVGVELIARAWLRKQDLSGKTPIETAEMYLTIMSEIETEMEKGGGGVERLVMDRGGYERVLSGSLTMLKEQQRERAKGENTWTEKEAVLIPLLEMLLPQSKSRIVVEYDPAEKKVLFIRESRDESGTNQAEKTR